LRSLTAFFFSVLASGCVFYPKLYSDRSSRCGGTSRHFELRRALESNTNPPNSYRSKLPPPNCDRYCVAAILAAGSATAAIAIVSGSIVVIGNTVFWVEESAECAAHDLRELGGGKRSLAEAALRQEEQAVWKFATSEKDKVHLAINLENYLEQYPDGRHVVEANSVLYEIGAAPNTESK
jgi:hypothetical protein